MLVVACGDDATITDAEPTTVDDPAPPPLDPDRVAIGADLYGQYCAVCHGADLEGEADWMYPNPDGSFRAPPHDSSGHTWHHTDEHLVSLILHGYGFEVPGSRMPAFASILSEDEVRSILDYFKSTWGPEERSFQWEITRRFREEG